MNQQRILGRHVARELTQEELEAVSGSAEMNTNCKKDDGVWRADDYTTGDDQIEN